MLDIDEHAAALGATVERASPGRTHASRPPTPKELAATAVLRLDLRQASAKVRRGPPLDDPDDLSLPCWAGVVPVALAAGDPVPTPEAVGVPPQVSL